MSSIKKDVVEGFLSLLTCTFGSYVSGIFLHLAKPIIASSPFVLGLLPIASDARGDVYSSYGSRLGTLLHLGIAERYMKIEILSLLILVIFVNLWVALLYNTISTVIHLPSADPTTITFVALCSAILSACFMIPSTTMVARIVFEKGMDPDNVVPPLTTLFGDLVTIPTLLLSLYIAWSTPTIVETLVILALLSLSITLFAMLALCSRRGVRTCRRGVRIVKENLATTMIATSFSAIAGAILAKSIDVVLSGGLLVVVPAFLEDGGAIACRFSSKLSTAIHLGKVGLHLAPRDPWIARQMIVNFVHAAAMFFLVGIFGALVTFFASHGIGCAVRIVLTVFVAGIALTATMSMITYYLALLAFKLGLDPDNVLAPILTSIADALGTTLLVTTYLLIA